MENEIKEELLTNVKSPDDAINSHAPKESDDSNTNNPDSNIDEVHDGSTHELTEEDIRLGGKPPFKTLCYLSVGPLVSQVASAMYGIINTIWVSKALGDSGLTAIATYQNFDSIGRSFAAFLQVSATTKIASLFGEGLNSETSQVFTDLLRISVLCSIFTPAAFIPLSRVCVKWFGADEFIMNLGFKYIVPNLCLSIVPCIFLIGCGCLQAEGRSWLFSATQVAALCLNMFVFCPMFLLGFKTGIAGAAFATGLSEFIPGFTVIFLFYRGKFGIKPKLSQMLNKFSPHSFEALKLGLAQLIVQISWCIPGIIVRKLIGLESDHDANLFNNVMAGFNTFNRLWAIEGAVPNAINIGFIPAAAYANGAKRYMRIIWLLTWALLISVVWSSLSMILTMGFPIPVAKIFSNTPEYLHWAKVFLYNGNILTCLCEIPFIITSLLQAMKKGNQASVLSFLVQLLPVPVAAYFLYLSDKHNIPRLILCYPAQILFGVIVSIPFVAVVLREIIKKHKEQQIENIDSDLENISVSNSEVLNKNTLVNAKPEDNNSSLTVSDSLNKDSSGKTIEKFVDSHDETEVPEI